MNTTFQKDNHGAVINNDLSEYETYKMRRLQAVREKTTAEKVKVLEEEVRELKAMIQELQSRFN